MDDTMKEEYTVEQLEYIIEQMRKYKTGHPKANVTFDSSKGRINITYPLPRDLLNMKPIKINDEPWMTTK